MIIFPADHYFECELPQLEPYEEIKWYYHPVFDLKCNQLGMIFPAEDSRIKCVKGRDFRDRYKMDNKNHNDYMGVGVPERLVYECYTQQRLKDRQSILFRDGNPTHLYYGNLVIPEEVGKLANIYKKRMLDFKAESRRIYSIKSKKLKERGIDPDIYWGYVGIPKWATANFRKPK